MVQEKSHFNTALFDMDGVLYNSMPNHVIAYQQSLQKFGYDMPREVVYLCEGMKGPVTMRDFVTEHYGRAITMEEAEEMYAEKCRVFQSMPKAEKIEGVEHLMRTMKDAGWQICVVTGSGQLSLLDRLVHDFPGLIDLDHIICSKDYANGKPAPDPYLMGLQRCNAKAEETVIVENAPLGVRAGKAAGIFTLAVNTGPLPESHFIEAGADKIFTSMREAEKYLFH